MVVAEDSAPSVVESREALIELPELDASDALVRELLAGLSEHPRWAAWLVPDDLVRRFVTTVVNVAAGDSPRPQLDFLAPADSFRVPESFDRYDLFADVFVSLDTEATARLYRALHPLFDQAHRELGLTARTFEESLAVAIDNLLAVEVPQGGVEVVPYEAVYEFRDRRLEALSPAEKHIVRLGPENARAVQQRLRELAAAIGIDPGEPASVAPTRDGSEGPG
jgi:hypothetical protein